MQIRKMRKILTLIVVMLNVTSHAQSPSDYKFQSISIAQGLSQSSAYAIFQDYLGYMWIGTQGGMNRFDGYGVKKYEPDANDSLSLGLGWRTAITEDENKILWSGTSIGTFSYYDRKKDQWVNIDPKIISEIVKKYTQLSSGTGFVTKIHVDNKRNKLYATTNVTGLIILDTKTFEAKHIWNENIMRDKSKFGDNAMFDILSLNDNQLIITTGNGIKIFDKQKNIFVNNIFQSQNPDEQSIIYKGIHFRDNEYFFSSKKGLFRYNFKDGTYHHYLHKSNDPNSLLSNQTRALCLNREKQKLWVSIDGLGFDILDIPSDKFTHINLKTAPNAGLKEDVYFDILRDKESNYWVGSSSTGLMKFDPTLQKMSSALKNDPIEMPLSFNDTWGVFIDSKENIWAGGGDPGAGITMLNPEKRESKSFLKEEHKIDLRRWVFGEDALGSIYAVGSSAEGVIFYRKRVDESKFSEVFNYTQLIEKKRLNPLTSRFFYLTIHGDLISSADTSAILVVDNKAQFKFENYKPLLGLKEGVRYIVRKSDQSTYILGRKHIYHWNEVTGELKNLTPWLELNSRKYFLQSFLDVLDDKVAYIPSFGLGLIEIDLIRKKFKLITKKEGIPNQFLYDVSIDKNGYVWSSTNFGIIRYHPKTKTFKGFYKNDGLQDFEYNANSFSRSKKGLLAYGGIMGLNYFHPEKVIDNPTPPPVIIQTVKLDSKVFNIEGSSAEDVLEVNYDQKNLSFEFIALNFKSSEFNQYAYKLEGFDRDWNYSGTRHFATYTNLPAGKYSFRVKASNNDGVWNEKGATLQIKVNPAPWETWWAYLIYLLLVGLLVKLFVGYREKLQKKKLDDDRKNSELAAARAFQLQMLPKNLPNRNDLEIATFLRSSTEIGGDYYDFFEQANGDLYVVCGDATGHGTISGMMVSIAKAGLNGISAIKPNEILGQLNRVIKRVDLGTMRMSLNIAHICKSSVSISSAAMPPVYYYHHLSKTVEEIQLSGLPLGGLKKETFDLTERSFNEGDLMVMISDGLPEAPNKEGDLFNYGKVQSIIAEYADTDAQTIKNRLVEEVDQWLNGDQNPDDITILVIKKKVSKIEWVMRKSINFSKI